MQDVERVAAAGSETQQPPGIDRLHMRQRQEAGAAGLEGKTHGLHIIHYSGNEAQAGRICEARRPSQAAGGTCSKSHQFSSLPHSCGAQAIICNLWYV